MIFLWHKNDKILHVELYIFVIVQEFFIRDTFDMEKFVLQQSSQSCTLSLGRNVYFR